MSSGGYSFVVITVHSTGKDEGRPERTVYAITEDGLATAKLWIREMLASVGGEFPEFPVGLSYLMMLSPQEAVEQF